MENYYNIALKHTEKEYSANDTIQYSISLLKSNISILQELYATPS